MSSSVRLKDVFLAPLNIKNPINIGILGICSALAVTSQLESSIVMALAVMVVLGIGNMCISLIRKTIPPRIRMIVQLVVASFLVTVVCEVLKAYAYDVNKTLSVFASLIVTNCILMGRFEAFALGNGPIASLIDGVANGLGYGIILIAMGFFRELLGSGKLLGFSVIPESFRNMGYMDNGFMILAPMAMFVLAAIVWVHKSIFKDLQEK